MKKLILIGALMLIGLSETASADQVYDNGVGGASGVQTAFRSDMDGNDAMADDFVVFSTTQVSGIQWTGTYFSTQTPQAFDDFTINIYFDDSGTPGALAESFTPGDDVNRNDSGFDVNGISIYEYSAALDFTAIAGTQYHMSIVNDTTADPDDDWYWGLGLFGNATFSPDGGASWIPNQDVTMDFSLTAIPEPGTTIAIGLLLLTGAARRKR
ncbi:MAG: PEP-CTERM sorting domain-containing protein [Planctomycetota bacterium]